MNKPEIVIIDYGVGNLRSLLRAFRHVGVEPKLCEDAEQILKADAVVLPGVGSFGAGMHGLRVRGIIDTVKTFARSGKPMLGICLGAQLLLSKGFEFGSHEGLDIIPGTVVRFPEGLPEKVPHIGWNGVRERNAGEWNGSPFESLRSAFDAYFVHSYILLPTNDTHRFAVTNYGGFEFASAVRKGNIYGCQFHPEKSGATGLEIIRNFVTLTTSWPHDLRKKK